MIPFEDWLFFVVGGFLLGAFLYTGYYTTFYEPEVKFGYGLMGVGIIISVVVNVWVQFFRDVAFWFKGVTLLSYVLITAGLLFVVWERRRDRGQSGRRTK